jgi:ribosomal protein L11 methyltransferase
VCYIDTATSEITPVLEYATRSQCALLSDERVVEENWTEHCTELWEPVTAGSLHIVPVQSLDSKHPTDPSTLLIIPGQGFGTGHHPTTRMIVEELSARAAALSKQELSIIDVGTGSGILAIAAAKLFNTSVQAIDNDTYAIANATDNVTLNKVSHLISPNTTPIEDVTTKANLIIANIYGEVLVQMAPHLTRLALPGCTTILSGITELVRDLVIDEYSEKHGWGVVSERCDNGWHCIVLTLS